MDNFGPLIMTGIKGPRLSKDESDFIRNEKIGGVILDAANFEDPAQLAELVNSLQKLRDDYPLFISVDHEGGSAGQFKTHFTQFPSMMEIAKLESPKIIFEVHQVVAKELSACGINLSYSPCCDILSNKDNKVISDRSFGVDSESVEKFISAAIRGLQTSNILSCAKHFPGMGSTGQDPRVELALVKLSLDDLRDRELRPFIKASKSRTAFMMMGHLLVDVLDEHLPTSLSSNAYQFLRGETKFSKLIITDNLDMKVITDRFTPEAAATAALGAGSDMLLFGRMESAHKALGAIREAVKKRSLQRDGVIEKLLRIEKSKKENLSEYSPIYIPKITDSFNSPSAKKLLDQILLALASRAS
jgi:beta-N-acetylhexosaminidase